MIRDSIKAAQVASMKSGDKPRLGAVRLILAKLKDRDIELRTASQMPDDDTLVVEVLQKMAKAKRARASVSAAWCSAVARCSQM